MVSDLEGFGSLRFHDEATDVELDLSTLGHDRAAYESFAAPMQRAFEEMRTLEDGRVANADENRMVGHYWLRAPDLAPQGVGEEIRATQRDVASLAQRILTGKEAAPRGGRFRHLVLAGIGGSALGAQFLVHALGDADVGLTFDCLDNTDPDGMHRVLRKLDLARTLFVVVSKSGGTKETRNAMLESAAALAASGLDFARQAVAVTAVDSLLAQQAEAEGWLARLPFWDWVGGRTSVTSAAGLLPAALAGADVSAFLAGAAAMDRSTRAAGLANPAALLACAWHLATEGLGRRAMVILPYRDRLELFGRYSQQLLMESLGKERDRRGNVVHQGLTVYGNKGSTDQHAYVQQLRDGIDNFFVCFLRVLEDGAVAGVEVERGITSADYLQAFWLGTRQALWERGRKSLTITMRRVDAFSLGALIALFERAVGLYASLIDVNAYHQPGVEAGKRAAAASLALRARILDALGPAPLALPEILARAGTGDGVACSLILQHLAANTRRTGVSWTRHGWRRVPVD